jgi:hypothetical protein
MGLLNDDFFLKVCEKWYISIKYKMYIETFPTHSSKLHTSFPFTSWVDYLSVDEICTNLEYFYSPAIC